MKAEFTNTKGDFYRVKVEATPFRFVPSKGPYRPPPPKITKLFKSGHTHT